MRCDVVMLLVIPGFTKYIIHLVWLHCCLKTDNKIFVRDVELFINKIKSYSKVIAMSCYYYFHGNVYCFSYRSSPMWWIHNFTTIHCYSSSLSTQVSTSYLLWLVFTVDSSMYSLFTHVSIHV